MRRRASEVLSKARLGEDTQAARKAERARKVASVGELVKLYLSAIRADVRPKTLSEYQRYLLKQWQPLHGRPVEEVSRAEVVTVIDRIADQSGRVSADRAKAALGAFFSWAIDRGYRDSTPLTNIRRRFSGGGRERVLSGPEIRLIWQSLENDDFGRILKLLLLTAQRKSEIGGLRWSEIDLERRQINLPSARSKNRRPHVIPLSAPALAILEATPRYLGRDLCFGQDSSAGYRGWAKAKMRLDARARLESHWVLHDVRRSVITSMSEAGIAPPHILEAIANHISGSRSGVAGVYDRSKHTAEKRRALDAWAEFLMELVK
jgi:integrase